MIVDTKFYKFTFMDYIADDTKFTDHSEMPYYTGLLYYVRKTYYTGLLYYVWKTYREKPGAKE